MGFAKKEWTLSTSPLLSARDDHHGSPQALGGQRLQRRTRQDSIAHKTPQVTTCKYVDTCPPRMVIAPAIVASHPNLAQAKDQMSVTNTPTYFVIYLNRSIRPQPVRLSHGVSPFDWNSGLRLSLANPYGLPTVYPRSSIGGERCSKNHPVASCQN